MMSEGSTGFVKPVSPGPRHRGRAHYLSHAHHSRTALFQRISYGAREIGERQSFRARLQRVRCRAHLPNALEAQLEEEEEEEVVVLPEGPPQSRSRSGLVVAFLAFLVLGICFYQRTMGWDLIQSAYFVVVTLTTVGYGDLVPTGRAARVFTVVYSLCGALLVAFGLSSIISDFMARQEAAITSALTSVKKDVNTKPTNLVVSRQMAVLAAALQYLLILVAGAIGFSMLNGCSLWEGLYFSVITALTVGYGDFAPTTKIGRASSIVWLVLATFGMARLISAVADWNEEKRAISFKQNLLMDPISRRRFQQMDVDGDNKLTKYEYLQWVLVKEGRVSEPEVKEILTRFDELDSDGDGEIHYWEL